MCYWEPEEHFQLEEVTVPEAMAINRDFQLDKIEDHLQASERGCEIFKTEVTEGDFKCGWHNFMG